MKITLQKFAQRTLSRSIINVQLDHAIRRMLAGKRGNVWTTGKPTITHEQSKDGLLYTATFQMKRTGKKTDKTIMERQIQYMQQIAQDATRSRGWCAEYTQPTEPTKTTQTNETPTQARQPSAISTDRGAWFNHLYGLDAQIEQLLSSVQEYERSAHANRFHCALYGAPACGKSEILRSLVNMVGNENAMQFDATSTTAAGAKQLLLESASIPPILCIEEIEKTDEQSLRWLLGVMDYRAEVRSVKFRSGLVTKEVKLLCLATVNDIGLFKRMMDGALASRFSHKIHCPRPSRQVLTQILEREITRNNGNPAWIAPALDWCINEEKTNDPRRIITVCLCGNDRLLTGEYQKILKATTNTEEQSTE